MQKNIDYLITHDDCADGKACAAVALLKFPSAKIIFCRHGDSMDHNLLTDKDVVIADFSFSREELLKLKDVTGSLYLIDHHKTAEAALKDLDFCHLDMTRCGSMLLWNYLFPDKKDEPLFLQYIQDRDLWTWTLSGAKEFLEGLDMSDWSIEEWGEAIIAPDSGKIDELKKTGKVALDYKEITLRSILKNAFPAIIVCDNGMEYKVMAVNSSVFSSDLGQRLAEMAENESKIGVIFTLQEDFQWKYSLRSIGETDTTKISLNFAGGGHRNASGFKSPEFVLKKVNKSQ